MQSTSIGSHAHGAHFPLQSLTSSDHAAQKSQPGQELTPEEQKRVEELKKRDREVRAHEQAHKRAAGKHATSGPTFEYETGPDGRRYAVSGEVQIDTSKVEGDPKATIRKAQAIKRAALAPQDPSAQDRRVAAEANRLEAEARRELAEQKAEERQPYTQDGTRRATQSQPSIVDVFV